MAEPVFQRPGEGRASDNPLGVELVFKVRGEQTDGSLTAFENLVVSGDGPPLHTHANEDEAIYVLEVDAFAALETPGPAASEQVGAEVGVAVVGPPLAQSNPL